MNNYISIVSALITLIAGHDLYHWCEQKLNYQKTIKMRAAKIIANPAFLKFKSLNQEVVLPTLEVQGTIPSWLKGTLIRNGAGKFETSTHVVSHPFDGFAMLHAFSFKNGNVSYANKFLESDYYKTAMTTGKIAKGFATDPCKLIFKKFFSYFSPNKTDMKYDNANINVAKIAEEFVALTETPLPIVFDKNTLKTNGPFIFEDNLEGHVTTSHPLVDPETKETFNYLTHFGKDSFYHIYSIPCNSKTRKLIASVPVEEPSYMHSFSLTENYIILTEIPFKVSPITLLFTNKPFIKNFNWKPEQGTIFTVVNRNDGSIVGRFKGEPFFTFHHVNAFEHNGSIVVDIITYDDASKLDDTSLDHIFSQTNKAITNNELKRFTINTKNGSVTSKALTSNCSIEMPQINYDYSAGKSYHYVYTLGSSDDNDSCLMKINIDNGTIVEWKENNCSVGEPVFVPTPDAHNEDDGVILSIILDAQMQRSFLLILDAKTFKEIGRAMVPHHIPFNLHGVFFNN